MANRKGVPGRCHPCNVAFSGWKWVGELPERGVSLTRIKVIIARTVVVPQWKVVWMTPPAFGTLVDAVVVAEFVVVV